MRLGIPVAALLLAGCSQAPTEYSNVLDTEEAARAFDETAAANDAALDEAGEAALLPDAAEASSYSPFEAGSYAGSYGSSYGGDEEVGPYIEPKRFDEDTARYDAKREAYRRGYNGFCTDDCSGHEAGFNWAHEQRLNREMPTFDSPSFDDGQKAYFKEVERRIEDKLQEFEMSPDTSEYAE